MILIEEQFENIVCENVEEGEKKRTYLKGIFMEAGVKNKNGRTYDVTEMKKQVERVNEQAKLGRHILGELDHPEGRLDVHLKNVSHRINEMWMEGNKGYGKAEVLESHPSGQILKSLIQEGITVGMSTRASGKVNKEGRVENFNLATVDSVANPSVRSAYPETIQEQLEFYKRGDIVTDLAEAVVHDEQAQKYFQKEMLKFIEHLKNKK